MHCNPPWERLWCTRRHGRLRHADSGRADPGGEPVGFTFAKDKKAMLVRDLMTRDPVTVTSDTSLADGLQRMAERRVRHLLVLNGDGDVVGIVSDRDLALFYDPQGITPDKWQQVTMSRLMTTKPVTIGSAAPLSEAARTLIDSGFSALPVVDNGQLVGILTERDFVKHALAD